jgi:outer membrane immunogenic protein
MKSVLLAGVAALALSVGVGSANAADIQQRAVLPAKAPAYVTPVFSWTGPYIGINGGYGWGTADFNGAFPGSLSPSGGLFGATLGYNWQTGPAVWGLEGDIDWSGLRDTGACAGATGCRANNYWLGTVRGRLGYNAGRWMPYVTGGLAVGDVHSHINGFSDTETTKAGWTLGAGVEAAIAGPWTAKIEYLYVDLGRGDPISGTGGAAADFKTNIIRGGINYRF